MSFSYLSLLVTGYGLGLFFPVPVRENAIGPWFGYRALIGIGAIMLSFHFGNAALGLPLGALAAAVGLAAVAGYGLRGRRALAGLKARDLATPVPVLSLLIGMVLIANGGLDYVPYLTDEMSNWLMAARQLFFTGSVFSPELRFGHPEYPKGWAFLSIFQAHLFGRFDDTLGVMVNIALHVALIGFIFEVLCRVLPVSLGRWITGIAWLVVLVFLLLEATWVLIPTHVLMESPQAYMLFASVMLIVLGLTVDVREWVWTMGLGLLIAFGYLIKVPMVLFVPAAVSAVFFHVIRTSSTLKNRAQQGRAAKRFILMSLLMCLPLLLTWYVWDVAKPGTRCTSNIEQILSFENVRGLTPSSVAGLALNYIGEILDYVSGYKLPVTLLALAGIAVSLARGFHRLATLAVLVYVATYFSALFWTYMACPDGFSYFLSSLPRYIRLPLRILQGYGLVMALLFAVHFLMSWKRLPGGITGRLRFLRLVVPAGLVLLGGGLVFQVERSVTAINTRPATSVLAAQLKRLRDEMPGLGALVEGERKGAPGSIAVVSSWFDNAPLQGSRHYSTGIVPGADLFPYSFKQVRIWKGKIAGGHDATPESLRDRLLKSDIVWPIADDPVIRGALSLITDREDCAADPTSYFLVRGSPDRNRFRCVDKKSLAGAIP